MQKKAAGQSTQVAIGHELRCLRCEHRWTRRNFDRLPEICPRCKSPKWNVPRPVDRSDPDQQTPAERKWVEMMLRFRDSAPPTIFRSITHLIECELALSGERHQAGTE